MTDPIARAMFREYGDVMRRICRGGFTYTAPDGRKCKHEDGWQDTSIAAMAREGGITGGGSFIQEYPEVHTENSLQVRMAVNGLDELGHAIFDGVWILRLSYRNLAKVIHLKKSRTAELVILTEDRVARFIRGQI